MTRKAQSAFVNALTFARVPLIFAWLFLAVAQEYASAGAPASPASIALACSACLMMLLSGLTDAWDGRLARKWNVVSTLGKMADPLMDKVFYIVAFPALSWQVAHQGESETHALVMLAFTIHGADVAAMWLGKVRTALSFPGAGWIYLYLSFHRMFPESWSGPWLVSCYVVEGVLVALTLWSLHTYTGAYMPYLMRALGRDNH